MPDTVKTQIHKLISQVQPYDKLAKEHIADVSKTKTYSVLLFDLDGVIIQGKHKYFSDKLSEEHDIPIQDVLDFFKNEYGQAARGKLSIRDVLPNYLSKWGWKGSLGEFLTYWFEGEREVSHTVVSDLKQLKTQGYPIYIASDNEKERADYLMRELFLTEFIDGTFFSYQVGRKKSEPEYFEYILKELGIENSQAIFIDDDPANVAVAKSKGINGLVFKSGDKILELIS